MPGLTLPFTLAGMYRVTTGRSPNPNRTFELVAANGAASVPRAVPSTPAMDVTRTSCRTRATYDTGVEPPR